ncbi:MAG: 2-oxoacid:acceptor oxidoreductase subunit alpha [Gammaproteobacteria bacterium]|jgi:2-oxoglutarate ferredoxin oxidoreductase subunit alpha
MTDSTQAAGRSRETLDQATILFCGDSGDGMQLTGTQMSTTAAICGNDVSTLPDYPAEIRAPAGSLGGVSAFQLHFASHEILTPGDSTDVLVAMNPAALKIHLPRLLPGGILIVDRDAFTVRNLEKAGYTDDSPLDDAALHTRYRLYALPVTTLTLNALQALDLKRSAKVRCKNFFALGLVYWLYDRPLAPSLGWIEKKFARVPVMAEANRLALQAGYHYGETADAFTVQWQVRKAPRRPGTYRLVNGNEAMALGLVTAARLADKPLVYSSYPITPASEILHSLSRWKHMDVRTIQAEDEIAAMGATIGAAYGGALAATGTSGPGVCLKSEALNLAVMLELPLVVINVQRGGPSTGMPTRTEQADLLQAMFGRHGESPIPVLAPASPADCFTLAIEAMRIAVRHMTPVFILSEGFLANSSESWRIPALQTLEPIVVRHPTEPTGFQPYSRTPQTFARPWVLPGTPGMEHRLGGLEKQPLTGNVSYAAADHETMCRLRADKIASIAGFIPDLEVAGHPQASLLVLGWGGSYGAIRTAVEQMAQAGRPVACAHLRYLNPFPGNLGEVLTRYERVLVPELNHGQLALLLRARYLVKVVSRGILQGRPFSVGEIETCIMEALDDD